MADWGIVIIFAPIIIASLIWIDEARTTYFSEQADKEQSETMWGCAKFIGLNLVCIIPTIYLAEEVLHLNDISLFFILLVAEIIFVVGWFWYLAQVD